jgi:hypothetical protein
MVDINFWKANVQKTFTIAFFDLSLCIWTKNLKKNNQIDENWTLHFA